MKNIFIILFVTLSLSGFSQKKSSDTGFGNYVPDEKTAIAIAEAVWLPIFGERIYESKPFVAKLHEGTFWVVKGTLNVPKAGADTIVIVKGGVPYIQIRKSDGRIQSVGHSK